MKAHRLLSIDRADLPRLATLTPTFAVVAACTVILASLSKALFLSSNPISLLPWMFLGAAAITATTSMGYVALMRVMGIAPRLRLLLSVGIASLLALRLAFPAAPALMGIVILLWCPAIGHLLVVQTWNVASSLLPTRQGKRLMPVLAAVTTLGAALGGLLVQLLLRWLRAEDLLAVAAAALLFPLARVRALIHGLADESGPPHSTQGQPTGDSEVVRGFRSILRRPLLTDLALLTFLLQAASLIVDYQFSAEIKPQFDKDGIAAFLGTFYFASNIVVLVLTLLLTGRFVRLVGIGVALAASGIVIGTGSSLYFFAAISGALPLFWVIAATAFAERVADYAFTKPAVQMVYMPLQTSGGERAKTIIDGVIYRVATAAVSVLLLVAAPELSSQFRLSLPATIACVVVVYLGLRVGPHYRGALFKALRARRLDADVALYLRDGLGVRALRALEAQLRSDSAESVLHALDVARELQLSPSPELMDELAAHDDDRVARGALATMEALGFTPSTDLVARMLSSDRPPKLLRALLGALPASPELADVVRPLTHHEDTSVASAACVFRIRTAGALDSFNAEMRGQPAAVRVTGMTRAGDFARELPDLIRHPNIRVRHDAIEQMGELGLAIFVPSLIACLDSWESRNQSVGALTSFGDGGLAAFAAHLEAPDVRLPARIALLHVVERIATPNAQALLVETCQHEMATLRDHAVEALCRQISATQLANVDAERLRAVIIEEIEGLRILSAIELALTTHVARGPRRMMFASEVSALQTSGERRIFRLLGLLYDRAALHRAYLHYRSPEARMRSNAIELLEQHIVDPPLSPFVALIERQEDAKGNTRPRSMVFQGSVREQGIDAVVDHDPWLARLWAWANEYDETRGDTLDFDDPLDRLVELKRMPMFAEATGEPLLEVAQALTRCELTEGERAFERGDRERDVYWLLSGELSLLPSTGEGVAVRHYECFGEMAAIDGAEQCCAAEATTDVTLARLPHPDFEDAVALFPSVWHRVIETLSYRLRTRIR